MAVATLSPVKILSDLGYEVWEMENDADMRSALIEAINTLTLTNPSDGRIPVLQDAVKNIQRPKFKTRKVSVNKLMNRKVSSSQKVAPQKLLPAASEEGEGKNQTIITSNLAERLSSIQESLQNLGRVFRQQLRLDKRVAAADVRNTKEADKLEREKQLEKKKKSKFGGFGFKKLAQPAIGFFDTLKRFFGNIFAGSILLGLLNWIEDNEDKITEFSDFFTEHLGKILIGLGVLAGLTLLGPILGLFKVLGWGAAILSWPLRRLFKPRAGGVRPKPFKPRAGGVRPKLGSTPKVTKGGNWFTRGLNKINPFKGKGVTKGSNWFSRTGSKIFGGKGVSGMKPGFTLPKIPGLSALGRFLGPLFFGLDLVGRKKEGQTNVQAVAGAGSAQAGFWGASAIAAKTLSPLLVTPIPGARVLYGVGVLGSGILGSMGLTAVADNLTGANKAQISPSTATAPPITSPTGTGNIQVLDMRTGGQQSPIISGGDGPAEASQIPAFSSSDPSNLSTITVRSIYGLVN